MISKGELVLIRYPGLNMFAIMKKAVYEVSKQSHELIYEFTTQDEFIKKGLSNFNIWCRLPDKHGLEGMDDKIRQIKKLFSLYTFCDHCLSQAKLYIEQPNGNLILVYEPKGGFNI